MVPVPARVQNGRRQGVDMAQKSRAKQVTGALAEMTGVPDEELRLALAVAAVAAGIAVALRVLKALDDLGSNILPPRSRGK